MTYRLLNETTFHHECAISLIALVGADVLTDSPSIKSSTCSVYVRTPSIAHEPQLVVPK
jgi:hypothetical protein